MEEVKEIWQLVKEFLTYPLFKGDNIHLTIGTVLITVLGFMVVTVVLRIINRLVRAKLAEEDRFKFVSIFNFLKYLSYLLVIVVVLNSSGVDLTVLLTASAALFVGLGFALQYLFQDIISGILIILDQSLRVGDIIEVDGKVGRVFEIKLRSTRTLTRDDKVLVIPNHIFMTNSIYNYTQNHRITRETVHVGVAYGSDVDLVTNLLLKACESDSAILANPKPFVLFDDFGDSALQFSLHFFIRDSFSSPRTKSGLRYVIDRLFRENQITIPFPQRDVHLYNSIQKEK